MLHVGLDLSRTRVDVHAMDEARRQLIRDEGQNVSARELICRAGFDNSRRASVARHLDPNQPWPKGHKAPPDIVRALAAVLPISESDLTRPATRYAAMSSGTWGSR